MKKWLLLIAAVSLLASGGTAYADGGKGKSDDSRKRHENRKERRDDDCRVSPGLERAIKNVKNADTKKKLQAIIDKQKAKCKAGDDDRGDWDDWDDWDDDDRLTPWERVGADYQKLQLGFASGDSAASVTSKLTLPAKGSHGTAIVWTSSRPETIAANGNVTRPAAADVQVVLTATVKYGAARLAKSFTVTVKAAAPSLTDAQKLAADKAALAIDYGGDDNADRVTRPLDALPVKGANGSTIVWHSSHPAVLSSDGKTLNRPAAGSGDATVVLTAVLTNGPVSDAKPFTLRVKAQLSGQQKVAADKAALAVDFGGTDTASRVTLPFDALPNVGPNGSAVTWISSAPSIVSNDGKTLNRPAVGYPDAAVVLTAILTADGYTDTKSFALTVKAQYTALEKLAADKADLAVGFAPGDSSSAVTKPIALPTAGHYGSSVIWYSSNTAIVSNDGRTVNRPAYGQGDAVVTLLAYMTNGGFGDVKSFTITVKQQPQA